MRHASATRKSNAPASAQEVARQLRPLQAPEPGPESRVVPEQAPAPNVAPASPTEVPPTWHGSDANERAQPAPPPVAP